MKKCNLVVEKHHGPKRTKKSTCLLVTEYCPVKLQCALRKQSKRTSFEIFVCSLVAIHTPFGSFVVYLVIGRSLIEVSLLRLMPTVFLFVIVHGIEVSPMSIFQFGGSTSQLQSYPSVRDSAPGYCKESFLYRGI